MTKWTRFMDMHSGGGTKEPPYNHIYIEAPEAEAVVIFYNRFGHSPSRVTCTCCGEDYSTSEAATLESASGYDRGCAFAYFRPDGTECEQDEACVKSKGMKKGYTTGYAERPDEPERSYRPYITVAEYLAKGEALVIRADEIKPDERIGDVPRQGYVWVD